MYGINQNVAYEPIEYLYHGTSSAQLAKICRDGYLERPEVTSDLFRAGLWAGRECLADCGFPICFRLGASDHPLTSTDRQYEDRVFLEFRDSLKCSASEQTRLQERANAFLELAQDGEEITAAVSLRLVGTARAEGNVPVEALELWIGGSEIFDPQADAPETYETWSGGWARLTPHPAFVGGVA